jgi:DNA-binding NarL/FixJ family response regulator
MRAIAARRAGDALGSRDLAGTARDRYAQLGWQYHVALCTELAGDAPAAARAFWSMGALFDARRLELGTVNNGTSSGDGSGLSPREWEIAELIAGGMPNRTVAERLTVSEKTVEKHLTAIYGKLGFRNRSQLAAFVIRKES